MTPRKYRLLVAAASEEIFRAIRSQVARDLRASATLQPQRCLPEQVEARLREADTEVLLVIADHCQEDLPAAVRRWRVLRPDLQVLFFFRRLPHTRALVELVRSGAFDVLETEFGATSEALIQDTLHHVLRRLDEIRVGSYERAQARQTVADVGLIGESAEMQNLFVQVMHAARLSCPVL